MIKASLGVGDIPARWAAQDPQRLCLHDAFGSHTWMDLERARLDVADRLATLGVRAGDRVMVVGENSPAMALLLFAVTTLGAWVVNVNARLSPREIALIREHSGARRVLYLLQASADARTHARNDAGAVTFDDARWGEIAISAAMRFRFPSHALAIRRTTWPLSSTRPAPREIRKP